jgi:hypothetical protein
MKLAFLLKFRGKPNIIQLKGTCKWEDKENNQEKVLMFSKGMRVCGIISIHLLRIRKIITSFGIRLVIDN